MKNKDQKYIKFIMLSVIILSASFSLISIPYNPKYSIYNKGDLGTSKYRQSLEKQNFEVLRFLLSPIILHNYDNSNLVVIVGSERKYTQIEIDSYVDFVSRGNSLIVFEDYGPARDIVKAFGFNYIPGKIKETYPTLMINRPTQFLVRDTFFTQIVGYQIPPLIVSDVAPIIDTGSFIDGNAGIPLLLTYPTAFLDVNDNNIMESLDLFSPIGFPLAYMKMVGNGTFTVVGDVSIPLNEYWNRKILGNYTSSNAIWVTLFTYFMAKYTNSSHIIFDESHQEIKLTSLAGIINYITGTWVGLINSIGISIFIAIITFTHVSLNKNKKSKYKKSKRWRDQYISDTTQLVSHPTREERVLSELYILYQVMGSNMLYPVIKETANKLRSYDEKFVDQLIAEYGDLNDPRSFEDLMFIYKKMVEYINTTIKKSL